MTNRREFLVRFTMAAGAVTLLKPLHVFSEGITNNAGLLAGDSLTILHTANLKGQWSALGNGEKLKGFGGLLNIRKKIEDINREAAPVLLIDSGNMTDACAQTHEERLRFCKCMQAIRYDAVIPGETDVSNGTSSFTQVADETGLNTFTHQQYPLSGKTVFPHRVIKKGKHRLGIIHVPVFGEASAHSLAGQAATMSKTAQWLKEVKYCTLVICLVQASRQNSVHLGTLSSHVDLIGSAAESTSIYNTNIIRNKMGHEVILSFAGSKGTMMSRIDFTFNRQGEKVGMASTAIFIGAKEVASASLLRRYNHSMV